MRSVVVDTAQSGTWREYFNEGQRGVWQWFLVHRRIRALLVGLAALPVLVAAVSPWWQLYLRDSASWPHHVLFAVHKGVMPERGELVAFQLRQSYLDRVEPTGRPRPQLRGDTAWVKRVMGMPGDRVDVVGNDVLINGQVVAQGIGQDRFGVPLELARGRVLQAGEYYTLLPHPRSMDSRYYGAVSQADFIGVAIPLL